MDYYIYYRAACRHAADVRQRVLALQSGISRQYGIRAMLKRRPNPDDDLHTWMEVYLDAPAGFEAMLAPAVEQSGLLQLIDGPRHSEQFLNIESCA